LSPDVINKLMKEISKIFIKGLKKFENNNNLRLFYFIFLFERLN